MRVVSINSEGLHLNKYKSGHAAQIDRIVISFLRPHSPTTIEIRVRALVGVSWANPALTRQRLGWHPFLRDAQTTSLNQEPLSALMVSEAFQLARQWHHAVMITVALH